MKQFFKFMFASMLGMFLSLIIFFIGIFIIFTIIIASLQTTQVENVPSNSVLEMKLDYSVPERTHYVPFSGFPLSSLQIGKQLGLNDILENIRKAKNDDDIKGIYLNLNNFSAGSLPIIEAIRRELLDFKQSGKFVVAFGDQISQSAYYLASTADKIFVTPQGNLDFRGFSLDMMFFKNTLQKLGIEAQVIRHGTFKSAVEPFTNEKMSDPNREQYSALLNSDFNHFLHEIEQSRNVSFDRLKNISDSMLVRTPEDAVNYGLIDSTLYYDEFVDVIKNMANRTGKTLNKVDMDSYASIHHGSSSGSRDRIAVIYALGEIMNSDGDPNTIGIKNITEAIKKAREDNHVKAIVMRVDSPGGDALTSDIIWREVEITKKVKPFVVSMGSVAASGGYYISCAADSIFAEPNTITGSIGVFGIIPNFKNFFNDKLGITFDGVQTGKFSDFPTVIRPMSTEEKNILQMEIDRIYKTFVSKVANGRNLRYTNVDSIAQGRVWTGMQAKEIGLVDNIGGLDYSIKAAAKMAKIQSYRVVEYPALKNIFRTIVEDFMTNSEDTYLKWKLGESYRIYQTVKRVEKISGIQARLPFEIYINGM